MSGGSNDCIAMIKMIMVMIQENESVCSRLTSELHIKVTKILRNQGGIAAYGRIIALILLQAPDG